jgi:hypothetical protein
MRLLSFQISCRITILLYFNLFSIFSMNIFFYDQEDFLNLLLPSHLLLVIPHLFIPFFTFLWHLSNLQYLELEHRILDNSSFSRLQSIHQYIYYENSVLDHKLRQQPFVHFQTMLCKLDRSLIQGNLLYHFL